MMKSSPMLKRSLLPSSNAPSVPCFVSNVPRQGAARRRSVRASMRHEPSPNVTLRVDFAPEVGAVFAENVSEISGELQDIGDQGPAVVGSVLAEMLWDAAGQAGGTESDKLEAFVKTINSRRFDSVLVTGLPKTEAEAYGEIYDMRRAALLGLAAQAGFIPRAKTPQRGEPLPRFDQWTTPVFPALMQLKPLPAKPSEMMERGVTPHYEYVLQESLPKTEGVDALIPPPVVAIAGTQSTEAEIRLTPFADMVRFLEPSQKPLMFLPQFAIKRKDSKGTETSIALPLATPANMNAKEFLIMATLARKEAKDDGWANILAGSLALAAWRLDARGGVMVGLTPDAERLLWTLRYAAVTQGEQAPVIPVKEGEVLFVNNNRHMHRTGGAPGPKYTVLAEKMALEAVKGPGRF